MPSVGREGTKTACAPAEAAAGPSTRGEFSAAPIGGSPTHVRRTEAPTTLILGEAARQRTSERGCRDVARPRVATAALALSTSIIRSLDMIYPHTPKKQTILIQIRSLTNNTSNGTTTPQALVSSREKSVHACQSFSAARVNRASHAIPGLVCSVALLRSPAGAANWPAAESTS